ncbi:MAG TPA: restriction endonuclease [Thermoanaerobaculia bacterium]|nr:restriction endonuclease [Thermoanaerobaculia bacterium]
MAYDFLTLSPDDFQLLVRDVLQAELGIRLETFTQGADEGIDLRSVDPSHRSLIVQCKRYKDFRSLMRSLREHELPKIQRLAPARYILATSVPMNPQRKAKLLALLRPFCTNEGDILGAGDLNNLIEHHPDVERRNFKLWLSSALVLDRVLHDGIFGEDEAALARARERLQKYVRNASLDRAMELLESERYCIIAGQPGMGKSMLADVIVLDHVERQGFEAVQISSSLDEIRTRRNPGRRLIYYFDDFLGKNAVEQLTRNEDRRLVDFIEDVRRTPNWRLVMATREYVYNQAVIKFEALAHAAEHLKKCIISLDDYTPLICAKILYNHLYYSDLPRPYIAALVEGRRYMEVVRHRNYNPRIVQYMTMDLFFRDVVSSDYPSEFVANLDNPQRIWHHAFHRHISREAQDLLVLLASFPGEGLLADVERVFSNFYTRRSKRLLSAMSPRAFEDALRELDGDFIDTSHVAGAWLIEFSNPSIRDFLNATLSSSPALVEDLIATATYFEQLSRIWSARLQITEPSRFVSDDVAYVEKLRELISSDSPRIRREYGRGYTDQKIVRVRSSKSERLLSILEIAEELQTPATRALVQEMIGEEEETPLDLANFGKDALVDVLLRLKKRPAWRRASSRLFSMIREFLLDGLDDVDDYKALGAFASAFPSAIDTAEWKNVSRRMRASFSDWSSDVWYDAEAIWGLHSDIEEIGRGLEVDVDNMLVELQDRASELEDEEERTPVDPYSSSSSQSSNEIEEIHALFASLPRR